jgi:hypothetical protein
VSGRVWRFLPIAAAAYCSGCAIVARARAQPPWPLSEREKRILALKELREMRILNQEEFDAEIELAGFAE